MRLALPVILLGSTAGAQTLMTPDEFDTWSTGKTLDYSVNGDIYGSERYFPGRKVLDANAGGPCVEGWWFARGNEVCFIYPSRDGEHCWLFWREGDQVTARYVTADPAEPSQSVTVADAPLACPDPDVGV